jgi:hypothetical protein
MKTRNQFCHCQAVELLHYIVPGGRVDARDALKILERPDFEPLTTDYSLAIRGSGGSIDEGLSIHCEHLTRDRPCHAALAGCRETCSRLSGSTASR